MSIFIKKIIRKEAETGKKKNLLDAGTDETRRDWLWLNKQSFLNSLVKEIFKNRHQGENVWLDPKAVLKILNWEKLKNKQTTG